MLNFTAYHFSKKAAAATEVIRTQVSICLMSVVKRSECNPRDIDKQFWAEPIMFQWQYIRKLPEKYYWQNNISFASQVEQILCSLERSLTNVTYLQVIMTVFSPSHDGLSAMILACVVTSCGESWGSSLGWVWTQPNGSISYKQANTNTTLNIWTHT